MGEIIKIRGVEFDTADELDMMFAEAFRNNDKDVIFGYEFAAYGRRVRNRKPKWRRLDKNTWVKWSGYYSLDEDNGTKYPVLFVVTAARMPSCYQSVIMFAPNVGLVVEQHMSIKAAKRAAQHIPRSQFSVWGCYHE